MAKVRSEHADVEASTVAHTKHGLRCELVGHPQPRGKGSQTVVDIAAEAIRSKSCNANDSFLGIGKAAVALRVHGLREINLPPQSVVDGQLLCCAPSVLSVEEPTFLTLRGSQTAAHKTVHL